jgi:hypothetical protein
MLGRERRFKHVHIVAEECGGLSGIYLALAINLEYIDRVAYSLKGYKA